MGNIKNVKHRKPPARWILTVLSFSQHISLCVAVACAVGLVMSSSLYQEEYGARVWLYPHVQSTEDRAEFFHQKLEYETLDLLRYAIIKDQMETDGVLDLNKKISISDYYYRKMKSDSTDDRMYFPEAVYTLESLIRCQQSGGYIQYLNSEKYTGKQMNKSMPNGFLTVDGKRLEELVKNNAEYTELCNQLRSCMEDLYNNFQEYKQFENIYDEPNSSLLYYIDLDKTDGSIYTNVDRLKYALDTEVQKYFENLECSVVVTKALDYGIQDENAVPIGNIDYYWGNYQYAMGDDVFIFIGINTELSSDDYYSVMWNAYENHDVTLEYIYIGVIIGCLLYYVLVMLYMMCTSGRKLDEHGEEYVELKWMDSSPLELFLIWLIVIGFVVIGIFVVGYDFLYRYQENELPWISFVGIQLATLVSSLFVSESICSLSRRLKSGTFFKNSFIYKYGISQLLRGYQYLKKCWKKINQRAQYYIEESDLWEKTWGIFLIEMVFLSGCIFMILLFMDRGRETAAIWIALGTIVISALASYKRMRRKIERMDIIDKMECIVEGENSRVNVEKLSLENAVLGLAVNEIGEGIQNAVKKSIKDEHLKVELLTNVSHDIKTPLTSIINYIDLLKRENLQNERAKEYLEVLENKSNNLKNLIQDLIEVSKISTGNIEYEMVPLNFHELILQFTAEYDEKFAEHCLKLVYNNNIKDGMVMADSRRIWRVMENLLSNIYKYALEGTRVYIDITKQNDKLVLTMKNISAKEIEIQEDELTERFVRGDSSRTTEGSGLGLAIAQNLVIGQGGTFKVVVDGDLFKTEITFPMMKA